MSVIKEASTIQANKKQVFQECPITYVMEKIGGYWKPIILFNLLTGTKRYSEIRKAMPNITEKVLIQHLKQLEQDELIIREAKPVVPPYVTYSLTGKGRGLHKVLYAMAVWAVEESDGSLGIAEKNLKDFPQLP